MKNQIQKTFIFLFTLFVLSSLISSCKKDDDGNSNPIPPSGATLKTAVLGTVTNTDGLVVSGVTVKLGTYTTTTDARGNFQFINADVPKDRMVLIASKDGYFKCVRAKKTQSGDANYINLLMEEKPAAVNIAGVAGGVVNIPGGAKITFPVNAFVDAAGNAYTGTVKVFARHISPGEDNFEAIVPGGDLSGINLAGQTQSLYSLGMIEAILTDNTGLTEVKLAPGKTAELKFPIDPTQTSSAQSTIPLWYMNETTGIWKEEGEAVKTGNFFIGSVSHFSTWNCDYSGERTDIIGKVIDCQGLPASNIVVTINGFKNVVTNNLGEYTTWVPAGYLIECQVFASNNPVLTTNSTSQTIVAVPSILNVVSTITLPCATTTRISGYIKTCDGSVNTAGSIYVSWNGGSSYTYSSTGYYNIVTPPSTNLIINVDVWSYHTQKSVISGVAGSTTPVQDLNICFTEPLARNEFTLLVNGVSTDYVMLTTVMTSSFTDTNSDGVFESASMNIIGYVTPGMLYTTMQIGLFNEVNGSYSLLQTAQSNVYITIDSVGSYGNGNFGNITENKLTVTDYGTPGGTMNGEFEFDHFAGTLTKGKFSLVRGD